ncbi:MAG: class I SAM-dependent RNA methyltransferase [Hyphomicrobiaceae bacterium]
MIKDGEFEIFLVAAPGLETALWAEARSLGFKTARYVPGGVTMKGGWPDVWRANLEIRGAGRVMVRLGSFKAMHLAQLDKRARQFPWRQVLRPGVPFRVEAACKKSRIYHSGAAAERIERAIAEELGAPVSPEAQVLIRARIEDDLVTIGIDTSGELLHKRGHKEAVAKAPMRETMAALFLRQCGYDGVEPVVDPMCGSGTFVIEAAEIAAGLKPGRSRHFAFEQLATFDGVAWEAMRAPASGPAPERPRETASGPGLEQLSETASGLAPERPSETASGRTIDATQAVRFHGSDLDAGAINMSRANAERAGVAAMTEFRQLEITELVAPAGTPGLVIINPPYGTRIGEKQRLQHLYRSLGTTLMKRFSGWRVGLITTDASLAKMTGLPFQPPGPPVSHGGLRVVLYLTGPL